MRLSIQISERSLYTMRFILDPFSSLLSLVPIVASLARTPSFAHHKLVAASLRSAPFAGTELSHSA